MKAAGYSGTPLAKKLGIKEKYKIRLINEPVYYLQLFTDMPENVEIISDKKIKKNFIHFFALNGKDLDKNIVLLKNEIVPNGIIWVSWPKKSSGVISDVNEDLIRNVALSNGLVDIKVCAVDETWSGLKLVIPVKDRIKIIL
jgi:hypothetical protein